MIQIKNLKAGYDDKIIVDISEFSIDTGEHCLILGKSGAGKTTLLFTLAGLLKPKSGSIFIGETDINNLIGGQLDSFRGRNIGIIYQTLHVIKALSVLQNITLVQYSTGLKQDVMKVRKLLGELGIGEHYNRKPQSLSQGQLQRVAIARAAINSPQIILGDEPTAALDDESCEKVMQTLLQTASRIGASLIIATHDTRIKKYFNKTLVLGDVK